MLLIMAISNIEKICMV